MVLADVVLGERPTPIQAGGALLVCLGVLAATATAAQAGATLPRLPRRAGPAKHREQDIAVAEPGRRRVPAQPVCGYLGREFDPQDRGELCAASES